MKRNQMNFQKNFAVLTMFPCGTTLEATSNKLKPLSTLLLLLPALSLLLLLLLLFRTVSLCDNDDDDEDIVRE